VPWSLRGNVAPKHQVGVSERESMHKAFILPFVANLVLLAVSYAITPERVAIHFGLGGNPDNWGPSHINALFMAAVQIVVFVSLFFSTKLTRILPKKYINIPNKSYWIRDENWSKAESILTKEMDIFGTAMFIFMFIAGLLVLQANLSTPVKLREDLFWWPFGIFMGFTAYWTIRLMTRYKIPKGELR
jgi:uncharacterized membrane protein